MGLIISHPSLKQNMNAHSTAQSEAQEQGQSPVKLLYLRKDQSVL